MTILVIEDIPEFVLTLRSLLKGHVIDAYSTLKAGIEAAGKKAYDLVLLDLTLVDSLPIDTLDRARQIKCSHVVIMTGSYEYDSECTKRGLFVIHKDQDFAPHLFGLLQ